MGKSLSFRGAVFEATDLMKHHRCKDPVCNTQLWKTRHQLEMAKLRIRQLEANIKEATLSFSPTSKEYVYFSLELYINPAGRAHPTLTLEIVQND